MVNLEWDRPMLLKAEEKRNVERYRMLKAGSIVFGGGVIDCVVRNLSDAGAALEVASPIGIPNKLTLIHGPDVRRRDCKVVWRTGNRIGVEFL
jgi:PilZ domain